MFHIKLVARPDARMVEVPLEVEAELPREFDGAALLASSGLPRKVKIKAQRDTLKLSTAYRADQLVGDVVRSALKGTPQDVTRVTEAAAAFVRKVRERRPDGASLLVQSNGRGKIEVVESIPAPPGRTPAQGLPAQSAAQVQSAAAVQAAGGTLADRLNLVERRLTQLEARAETGGAGAEGLPAARAQLEATELRLQQRLEKLEERLASALTQLAQAPREPQPLSASAQVASLPTPGSARTAMRRATAVEAFAEGLRNELKGRAVALAEAAGKTSSLLDKADLLALDAEQSLGATAGTAAALRTHAQQAAARAQGLRRVADEADLYAPGELPVAAALLDRLGATPGDEAALAGLRALAEPLLSRIAEPAVAAWIARAAPLCGWTMIAPEPGAPADPALHELDGSAGSVSRLLAPGLLGKGGEVLRRARVEARQLAPEQLPELEPEPGGDSVPPAPVTPLAIAALSAQEVPQAALVEEHEAALAAAEELPEAEVEPLEEEEAAAAGRAAEEGVAEAVLEPDAEALAVLEPEAELEPAREPVAAPAVVAMAAPEKPAEPPAERGPEAVVELAPPALPAAVPLEPPPGGEAAAAAASPQAAAPPEPESPPQRPFEAALPPIPGEEGEPHTPSPEDPQRADAPAPPGEPVDVQVEAPSQAAAPAAETAPPAVEATTVDHPAAAVQSSLAPAPIDLHALAPDLPATPEQSEVALASAVAAAVETEVSGDQEWARIARGPEAFELAPEPPPAPGVPAPALAAPETAAPAPETAAPAPQAASEATGPVLEASAPGTGQSSAPPPAAPPSEPPVVDAALQLAADSAEFELGDSDVVAEEIFDTTPEDLLSASDPEPPALAVPPPPPGDAGDDAPPVEVSAQPPEPVEPGPEAATAASALPSAAPAGLSHE